MISEASPKYCEGKRIDGKKKASHDAGKDRRQEKGTTEDKMIKWHHQLNGYEFDQAPGDGEGQGNLVGCSPWGCKELDMTEQQNKFSSVQFREQMEKKLVTCC